ncbi:MAG: TonB-dependent receptor [Epsilonproteobacteria bacterium]|nr:TonB-dependent receptor [Campylobacterota bacterium]
MNKIISLSLVATTLLVAQSFELEPVSVTATGIEEKVLKQPVSISTKGESEIELDEVIFQKDLLNSLSGVRIEQTGSVIGHMTSIRMPINTGPYYLFMQDGIPVQSSGFFNHNGLAYTTFQTATNVEVLKGAGSALYGSDAVAAVVNVQSLKAPAKQKEIVIRGMGGSYGYGSGFLSVSDSDEKSGYRANVNYMHSNGWRDHTETDRFEANVRYDQTINDDNDIKVMFNISSTDAEQADSFNDYENIEDQSTKASDDDAYFTALEKTDVTRQFDYARLSLEWVNYAFNDIEVTLTPYLRYNRNQYVATWESNLPSNDNKLYTFGLNNRNTYEARWGKVVFGFDSEYTQSSLQYTQDFDITTSGWKPKTYTAGPLYDYDVDYYAIAPYMSADYFITKAFMLRAGLRYDYNRFEYTNNLQDNSTDPSGTYYRIADRSDNFSHLSPKIALSYIPTQNDNIYLRYANGFRIPQASRLYSVKVGYEAVSLDPETTNTYELGYKHQFDKKGIFELALYYMTIDDTITRYEDDNGIRYYDNGQTTIHQGIETTVDYAFTNEYMVHVAYSYSEHTYDNDPVYGDNEIAQAPNHLANVRLVWSPEFVAGLRVMPEWQYVGSYWMDDEHTHEYDGYSIGNLKVDYAYSKSLRLFGKVTNITDEAYAVTARYAYRKTDYTPGDPRSFYAGLEYRW